MDCAEIGCVVRDQLSKFCTSQGRNTSACVHVHNPFPCLGNGWTDCAEVWCMVRDPLAMPFTQTKGGAHLQMRTCESFFGISGTDRRNALKFGVWLSTTYAFHACPKWGIMYVLKFMCAPLLRILGCTGRIIQKFGVFLDPLTMHFTQAISGGYLHVRKCNRTFF